jgi:hypothetical protein
MFELSKPTTRVVLNRKAFDAVSLGIADGLFEVALAVLDVVEVPDAPPKGQGLIQGGAAMAWVGKRKVNGTTIGGRQVTKPRSLRLQDGQATAIVGFGFPARFVELGTVDAPAEPFLTPAVATITPDAEVIISPAIQKRLAGIRSFGGRA